MAGSPYDRDLFDMGTLKEVVSEFEGAAATSSHLDLSKAVAKGLLSFNKPKAKENQSRSPVVPPTGNTSGSNPSASSMFQQRGAYRGKGGRRGNKGGGRGRGGGAPASQGAADKQPFQK